LGTAVYDPSATAPDPVPTLRCLRYLLLKDRVSWFGLVVGVNDIETTTRDEQTTIEQKETKETKNSKGSND
jgi:hypothetical protein